MGTLADFVLEPAMRSALPSQGTFANLFGGIVGHGTGAGMGLLTVFCGLAAALVGLSGYFIPAIRNAEDVLPDYEQPAPSQTPGAEK